MFRMISALSAFADRRRYLSHIILCLLGRVLGAAKRLRHRERSTHRRLSNVYEFLAKYYLN